jgi:hypothetical protein
MSSTAFQEFLQKRCEEIAGEDREYQELSKQSMIAYCKFKKALDEFVNISTKFHAYAENLMLKTDMYTARYTAQNQTKQIINETIDNDMIRKAII